jgi:hypothetical protein
MAWWYDFRDVFTGIGAEVTEQVEFGVFQNLVINQRKTRCCITYSYFVALYI